MMWATEVPPDKRSPMSVWDDEMGPLCPQDEAERAAALASAGLTLEEYRAWLKTRGGNNDGQPN